jgi:hypothetical protein
MLPCSWGLAWSVPWSAEYHSAVNRAPMLFSHDAPAGVQAISALFALAQVPTRPPVAVGRCGLKLSRTIAIRTSGLGRHACGVHLWGRRPAGSIHPGCGCRTIGMPERGGGLGDGRRTPKRVATVDLLSVRGG